MSGRSKSEKIVRDIKRHSRRKYSSEEKIRIVLEGLRGETSIAELCQDFLEAGKKRLEGDTVREANSDEVGNLRKENNQLKQVVADLFLKNRILKKSLTGSDDHTDDI
jgi:transposase